MVIITKHNYVITMATYNCSLHVESKMAVENVELKEQY